MKLVRDKLAARVFQSGRARVKFVTTGRGLTSRDRVRLLHGKLLEEAGEVIMAEGNHKQLLKELADVYEVLAAIGREHGLQEHEILMEAIAKRGARGGFEHITLMEVEPDDWKQPPLGDGRWYSG